MKKSINNLVRRYSTNRYRWLNSLIYLTIIGCTVSIPSLQAHPHSWVDLKTEITGNDTQISGFKMSWTFDAMTSAYMLDGEDLSEKNRSKTLQKVADSVMNNINLEHYFTYLYAGETPIKYSFANQGVLTQNKTKLTLDFYLPLAQPKDINGQTLRLLIFEPSYYVDMSWENASDIKLSAALSQQCALQLVKPKPTAEQVAYAMSLPADADPDNELGQLFSQTVMITCAAQNE